MQPESLFISTSAGASPNFKQVLLAEIADISTGSSNVVDSATEGQFPFYDRSDKVKKSNKWLYDVPDAIIVPGESSTFIPKMAHGKFDLHQRAYAIFPKDKVEPSFLYYTILNSHKYFAKVATGSTVLSLRLGMFQDMPIYLPPKATQRHIASTHELNLNFFSPSAIFLSSSFP